MGRRIAGGSFDETFHVSTNQPRQRNPLEQALTTKFPQRLGQGVPQRYLHVLIGTKQQEPGATQFPSDELEQRYRRLVGPMQVVKNHQNRLLLGCRLQESCYSVEQAKTGLLQIAQGRFFCQAGDFFPDLGHQPGDLNRAGAHFRAQPFFVPNLDIRTDHLYPRPVRRHARLPVATPPKDLCAAQSGVGSQFLGSAGLSDAGIAHHHYQAPTSGQ